jgi:TIR domain
MWAEWIAWELEEAGYRVLVQAWDFVPGSNWIGSMQDGVRDAARTIAVLSEAYLGSVYGGAEWQAAWAADPAGRARKLLPVRVEDCGRPGLLAGVTGFDLFGLDDATARQRLLSKVGAALVGRAKPIARPAFPLAVARAVPQAPMFPGEGSRTE